MISTIYHFLHIINIDASEVRGAAKKGTLNEISSDRLFGISSILFLPSNFFPPTGYISGKSGLTVKESLIVIPDQESSNY
jgi:hypothetical protein